MDVARNDEKVSLVIYRFALEPVLEQAARSLVTGVERARVQAAYALHAGGDLAHRRAKKQMNMIAHKAPCKDFHGRSRCRRDEEIEKALAIFVSFEYQLTPNPTTDDVIDIALALLPHTRTTRPLHRMATDFRP